jgi:hypothetical protein
MKSLSPGEVAAADQVRAEARELIRTAPIFFVSLGDGDGQHVLGSVCGSEPITRGFLFVTIASVWEWVAEITGESDAQLVHRLMLTLAVRRDGVDDDEGGDADQEE